MGMILGFLLLIYILLALGVYKLTKRFTVKIWLHRLVLAILILIPTYDIIITNVLGAYYCLAQPSPKTFIQKKVEYPISIYWTSSVGSGFDKEGMKPLIINYLDGVHLKTMALNGDDGKVYVYHLDNPIWAKIKKEFDPKRYKTIYAQYAQTIINKSQKIYTKETMPKMNYTVTFDEVKLNALSRKFLYSDETKVTDNKTGEVIAYNRRYMHFFYNITPDFALGNRYYAPEPICGYKFTRNFDEMVFPSLKYLYIGEIGNRSH